MLHQTAAVTRVTVQTPAALASFSLPRLSANLGRQSVSQSVATTGSTASARLPASGRSDGRLLGSEERDGRRGAVLGIDDVLGKGPP